MRSLQRCQKRKSKWTKLCDEKNSYDDIERGRMILLNDDDCVDPNSIVFILNPDKTYNVSFKMGLDSITIPFLSNSYCIELRNLIHLAQQNNKFIHVDFNNFSKQNPTSVYSTFVIDIK